MRDFVSHVAREQLTEAYAQLGVDTHYIPQPANRTLIESNASTLDGETNRIVGLSTYFPNLLHVPVPLMHLEWGVFFISKDIGAITGDADERQAGVDKGGYGCKLNRPLP